MLTRVGLGTSCDNAMCWSTLHKGYAQSNIMMISYIYVFSFPLPVLILMNHKGNIIILDYCCILLSNECLYIKSLNDSIIEIFKSFWT